jgi:hypothetical protein
MTGLYVFVHELFERTYNKHSSKVFFEHHILTFPSVHVGSVDRYGVTIIV